RDGHKLHRPPQPGRRRVPQGPQRLDPPARERRRAGGETETAAALPADGVPRRGEDAVLGVVFGSSDAHAGGPDPAGGEVNVPGVPAWLESLIESLAGACTPPETRGAGVLFYPHNFDDVLVDPTRQELHAAVKKACEVANGRARLRRVKG